MTRFRIRWGGVLFALVLCGCGQSEGLESPDATPTTGPDAGSAFDAGPQTSPDSGAGPGVDGGATCTLDCSGTCVDPRTDPANCGSCGNRCTSPNVCVAGVCQSDPEWAAWPVPPDRPTDYLVEGARVTDRVTGLVWEQATNRTEVTWAQADAYCRSLSTGGLRTWRLPTRIELVSLLSTGTDQPFVNSVFASTPLWASAVSSSRNPDYSSGDTYYSLSYQTALTSHQPKADEKGTVVRCVASPSAKVRAGHYTVADKVVTDNWTGLVWERGGTYLDRSSLSSAQEYCDDLDEGGYSDWRLPSRKELETLLTPQRQGSYHIDGAFDVHFTSHGLFWTRSMETVVGKADWVWLLNFKSAVASSCQRDSGDCAVRCVR